MKRNRIFFKTIFEYAKIKRKLIKLFSNKISPDHKIIMMIALLFKYLIKIFSYTMRKILISKHAKGKI